MASTNHLIAFVKICDPMQHLALAVYPLTTQFEQAPAGYLVLDEAMATGHFRITEVSESGAVPRLLAINETKSAVFLLDGEELVGAKQNRVLNLSILLPAQSKTEIPVSCVEAGRWHSTSGALRSGDRLQFSRARADKIRQVSASLAQSFEPRADQGAIWEAIEAKSERMGVSSPTGAMAAIFDSRREELECYVAAFPSKADQIGAIFVIGGTVVGLELFDDPVTYRKLAGKLVASYALDAMEHHGMDAMPDSSATKRMIGAIEAATHQRFSSTGVGETIRLSGGGITGAALEVDGRCIHLAAFPRDTYPDRAKPLRGDETYLHRASRRRSWH